MMPTFPNVSSSMRRDRLAIYPPLPHTRQAIVVPPMLQRTSANQQFFLSSGK
jgi:hypothetical protein